MIYVSLIHMILRGHLFAPELDGYDKYYTPLYKGCKKCKVSNPIAYRADRHNNGICPKKLAGYEHECKGRSIDGLAYGECGSDD